MIANCDDKIIKDVIKQGAAKGATEVSTLEIAKHCKMNESTVFVHFKTKKNLLLQAFLSIDKSIGEVVSTAEFDFTDIVKSCKNLWYKYMDYLVSHPDEAKYYMSYRVSYLYTKDTHLTQDENYQAFLSGVNMLAKMTNAYGQFDYSVLWTFIIENSLSFAVKFADGKLENSIQVKEMAFGLIFNSIFAKLLGKLN